MTYGEIVSQLHAKIAALEAELAEHRRAEEIQLRRGWHAEPWASNDDTGVCREWFVVSDVDEWVHIIDVDMNMPHIAPLPRAALIAAEEWVIAQGEGK